MKHQPSTLTQNVLLTPQDTYTHSVSSHSASVSTAIRSDSSARPHAVCAHFTRSALFTALTTSLVGFGVAPTVWADAPPTVMVKAPATQSANSRSSASSEPREPLEDGSQVDAALDALRLKKAVEQGIVDQSVLDEYSEQSLGLKKSNVKKSNTETSNAVNNNSSINDPSNRSNKSNNQTNNTNGADRHQINQASMIDGVDNNALNNNSINDNSLNDNALNNDALASDMSNTGANDNLLQQAAEVQQQGYQMMTPEQIERELAAINRQNNDMRESNSTVTGNSNVSPLDGAGRYDRDFDAPIASLDDTTPPVGLDMALDATNLPTPSNLETLGKNEKDERAATQAQTDEVMSRPIDVSDSVSSGRTNEATDSEIVANTSAANGESAAAQDINPDDYLPDYQTDTQAVSQSIEQADEKKPLARNNGNIIKRLYNRLFNGGVRALPHVDTTVYLQQAADTGDGKPKLKKADDDTQPIKNIKAALDDTTVQSVVDFTAALPRLRQTALDAAKAVGYYDVTLRLRQPNSDRIDVIIENLGEPVRVDSRIVEIRGEGGEQPEFAALETDLPPQEGDIFNHRVYKNSKAALESLSNTYGYFDEYWLNKSVDIILPDNTADVALVYNTGDRYEFDDVVFFTYDEATNTLTRDPDKLPVEMSLLQQLIGFEPGDKFYRPAVTKFSNDLSATRYFNTVNVESILPPDESSEASTLAFDNAPTANGDEVLDNDVNNGAINNAATAASTVSNDGRMSAENGGVASESSASNSGATVDPADIAAIEFEADEATLDKLQVIKQKAERLSRLPNDRVLDEKDQEADSILGKISDSISNVAQKIFPDEKSLLADENFVPPTLAGRKTPQDVAESKKVPLYVFVSSNKPRDAQVGLGYGTDTGVRATAKIDYNLLNRQGYQAGAETEVSRITKNVAVYGSRPWKHPLNDKLDGRLTYEEEVIDQGEGNFDLSTKTLKAAIARNIRRDSGWNRSYSMRYRLDELETGVDETELDDLPIRFTSSKPKQRALLFGYGMNKTDVDSTTNPTRGIRQYYSLEAGTDKALSDTDLAIVRAGVSGIYSFGDDKKHQVLGSLNTGYIWADDFYDVPYKLRFFAGGDQSIRGYDYESLSPLDKGYLTGGQVLAVGSAEYNYEFRPGFRGAFFTDVGNAYDKDFETDTKVGVGVGIRWASPVGVVRVDVAAGVTEESIPVRLHFFIGSPL